MIQIKQDTAADGEKAAAAKEASKQQKGQQSSLPTPPAGASKDDLFGEGASLTFKRKRDPVSGLPLSSLASMSTTHRVCGMPASCAASMASSEANAA